MSPVKHQAPRRDGSIRSLSPAALASEVAARPAGGSRKKGEPVREAVHRSPGLRLVHSAPETKHRVSTTADGLLVDACDAAVVIARLADNWDSAQVLAHSEIVVLALQEAHENLDEMSRQARHRIRGRRKAEREVEQERQALSRAVAILTEAQSSGLVRGF